MATGTPAPKAGLAPYKVLSTLHHDKKIYRKGETVALSDRHAEPLLKIKTVEPIK